MTLWCYTNLFITIIIIIISRDAAIPAVWTCQIAAAVRSEDSSVLWVRKNGETVDRGRHTAQLQQWQRSRYSDSQRWPWQQTHNFWEISRTHHHHYDRHIKHVKHCIRQTDTFTSPFSGTSQVSWYQKSKTNLHFTEARDSEWQWHQLGHMQVCTSLQTDNHASTPLLSFLQARCPSCRPTNSVKALKH